MAQIDASIYQNVGRPAVQLADPLEAQTKQMQLKSLLGQQQLQQLNIQQATEEADNQRTLSDLYRSSVNPDGSVNRSQLTTQAAQRGLGAKIPALQKGWADADKAAADVGHVQAQTDAEKFKTLKSKLDTASGAINSLLSNPGVNNDMVINTLTNLVQQGIMPQEQGAQIARSLPPPDNPAALRTFLIQHGLQAMDASKRMEMMIPKTDIKDTGSALVPFQTNQLTGEVTAGAPVARKTMTPGESASNAIASKRLAFDQAQGQNSFVPVDGVGLFVGNKATGQVRPVTDQQGNPIKPQKTLNQEQSNALLFGSRMREADKIINELAGQGVSSLSLPQQLTGGQGITGSAATAMATPQQQQVDQAQRDFINAVLRRESGASISPTEFDSARKQYFVQSGDSDAVISQKAKNRQLAMNGMLLAVPQDQRNSLQPGMDVSGGAPAPKGGFDLDTINAELARRKQK